MQILGEDVERAARGERPREHRSRNVVERPAGAGADRNDLRPGAEVDPRIGADQHAFERRDEVGPSRAFSTSVGPGSDVNTTALASATARGLSAQRAPSLPRSVVASRRKS
jgi:hypothetical protein